VKIIFDSDAERERVKFQYESLKKKCDSDIMLIAVLAFSQTFEDALEVIFKEDGHDRQ
jgi:hypothetical protein